MLDSQDQVTLQRINDKITQTNFMRQQNYTFVQEYSFDKGERKKTKRMFKMKLKFDWTLLFEAMGS